MLRKARCSFGAAALLSAGVLSLYAVMTGGAPSAVRSVIMFFFFLGAQVAGRTYDLPTALVCAAVLMLLGNAKLVTQAGFLLSFAAVLSVYMGSRAKYPLFQVKGIGIGAASWLVTLPLVAWFYCRVPVYGIFLNLLVIPLMPFVMVSGILAMLAGLVMVSPAVFLAAPAHYILYFLRFLCEMARMLPGSTIVTGRPKIIQIVIYYLLLLYFFLFFGKKRKIDLLTGAFGIILIVSIVLYRAPQKWTMTFLNVGQGDGCCIRTPQQVWMIDGGSSDRAGLWQYTLQPYLEYQGIGCVDYWMVSHYDTDHISGLLEALEGYQRNFCGKNACGITIGHIVLPAVSGMQETADAGSVHEKIEEVQQATKTLQENPDGTGAQKNTDETAYEKILALAGKHQIPVLYAKAGDVIRQGDTVIRILAPDEGRVYTDTNEASMVAEVSYSGFRALLTGDVEGRGEQALLEAGTLRSVDVLKVAHHGSKNSTLEEFLEQTAPEMAVISCGKDNRYGHPHQELLKRLEKAGSRILRVDHAGAVDVIVGKKGYGAVPAE